MRQRQIILLLLWLGLLCGGAKASAGSAAEQVATQVLLAVNSTRVEQGLSALQADATLAALALSHSRRMAEGNFLSHTEPGGRSFAERMRAAELQFSKIAENIAMNSGTADPAATAVSGWLRSQGHRANIFEPAFSHTGVGAWVSGGRYYFTQIFMTPP